MAHYHQGWGKRGARIAQGVWRVSAQEGGPARASKGRQVRPECSQSLGRDVSSQRGWPVRASNALGGKFVQPMEGKPPGIAVNIA